jgi:hypothetical protein
LQILGILQRDARLIDFLMEDVSAYSDEQVGPATVKLLGNVPPSGKAPGGVLRHKGWRAEKIDLPALAAGQNAAVLAPAEIEVE